MKKFVFLFFMILASTVALPQNASGIVENSLVLIRQSELSKARGELDKLKNYPLDKLKAELTDQTVAKAFWVNYYNATVQVLLLEDPKKYDDRGAFFSTKWTIVAGHELSLDDIEHGIIRGSKHKYTLGYTSKFFVEDFEETFRLDELDYRVHFALNCGALSCPPVAIYKAEALDKQLEVASKTYLTREVRYDASKKRVAVPVLCQWFYADFGKELGIREMLNRYLPEVKVSDKAKISYLDYDWTVKIQNFIKEGIQQ